MAEKRLTRVTSFDVAEAAGVSQSTVSRALAGDPRSARRPASG
jgi:DNA-binding LacI/PurR family transcriptional regulator